MGTTAKANESDSVSRAPESMGFHGMDNLVNTAMSSSGDSYDMGDMVTLPKGRPNLAREGLYIRMCVWI